MLRQFSRSYAEVAEIDPVVTKAAFEAFGLEPHPQMKIFNLDARNHVDDLLLRLESGEPVERSTSSTATHSTTTRRRFI